MSPGPFILIVVLASSFLVGMRVLAFSVFFPEAWGRMVDRVHGFCLSRRLLSVRMSGHLKVLEKGFVVRLAMVAALLIIAMDIVMCVIRFVFGLKV